MMSRFITNERIKMPTKCARKNKNKWLTDCLGSMNRLISLCIPYPKTTRRRMMIKIIFFCKSFFYFKRRLIRFQHIQTDCCYGLIAHHFPCIFQGRSCGFFSTQHLGYGNNALVIIKPADGGCYFIFKYVLIYKIMCRRFCSNLWLMGNSN